MCPLQDNARECDEAFYALKGKVADLDEHASEAGDHTTALDIQLTDASIERQLASFNLFSAFMAEALTIMPLS